MQCTGSNCSVLLLCDFGIWSRATRLKAEKAQFMKKSCLVLRLKQHDTKKKKKKTSKLQRTRACFSMYNC